MEDLEHILYRKEETREKLFFGKPYTKRDLDRNTLMTMSQHNRFQLVKMAEANREMGLAS
jgi:hypothetical protein